MTDATALAELTGCRTALERIADVLEFFRGEAMPVELEPATTPAPAACPHPLESRVSFSGMGEPDEWECATHKGGCGFRTQVVEPEPVGADR